VVFPAVVRAAEAVGLRDAVDQSSAPMRAVGADEAELAAAVAVEHEFLAQDSHLLGRMAIQLRRRSDWIPIAAEQPPHRRLRADSSESFVVLLRKHKGLVRLCFLGGSFKSYRSLCVTPPQTGVQDFKDWLSAFAGMSL